MRVLAPWLGLFAGNKNHQGMTQNHPKLGMDEASKAWQLLMRQPPAVRKKVTVMRALEELELSLRLAIFSWDSYIIINMIIYIYIFILYYTILYYIILYDIILYYIILYYYIIILYYYIIILLYYIILYYILLYYIILY